MPSKKGIVLWVRRNTGYDAGVASLHPKKAEVEDELFGDSAIACHKWLIKAGMPRLKPGELRRVRVSIMEEKNA